MLRPFRPAWLSCVCVPDIFSLPRIINANQEDYGGPWLHFPTAVKAEGSPFFIYEINWLIRRESDDVFLSNQSCERIGGEHGKSGDRRETTGKAGDRAREG